MNNRRNHPKKHVTKNNSKFTSKSQAPAKQYTVKEPSELLPFLLQHITHLSRNSIKSLLTRGQVLVNDRVVTTHNHVLHPGQMVSLQNKKVSETPPMIGIKILFEDDDVIVIQKEAGLLSIASPQEKELTVYRQLMTYVRVENPKNRIFVVHRLDRDTSGVMMFAKNEHVQQALQNSWKDSVKERLYVALVEGNVKKQAGTISSWLKESSTLKMYSSHYPNDGQHAVTHYKLLQSDRNFSLLEVQLETGRKNQIRVHMEDIGHPIVGDKKYGAKSKPIGRLGLHARVLAFVHPSTGELLRFETDIPKTFFHPFKKEAQQ
ncbi:RluA family pseudouridine synthase [Brevibacillus laterosporus]|uniref:Pseudouridine synthase n=1 Tax=Brevibacillus laterosporus TaxID=1465 RepID=A0AAP3DFU0_BRELA|nr:RluA family pseudouridine synthase [Brevibacillus laterosporus]MCR8980524.1 RluA family pseudouridine synthase [Brevibacillus laterosporus]MCZ0807679.1 RluA family pseudouridine synthase [Brevibacillus laterosporus]MCZ0827028.1 RluA family pseudouridine synthase [Brevibacillus laterosporus]MCZ0851107.1 RluA family pseudouridine synthase [Brevibacillus laterosporus]MED1663994.1 RluA family pseudouridine synthase [Brevibacillus laterosporus]